jgi:hypothetical protein
MKTLLFLTCALLACDAAQAGQPNATAPSKNAPVVDVKPESAATYLPKTRSVFTATADEHNPFWPIGWVKTGDDTGDSAAPTVPHSEDFLVTTILLNDPAMAVINGKDMAEGEIAALPVNGQNIVVQLMAVRDGSVVLRWQNQNLVVPIHRVEDLSQGDSDPQR